MRVNSFPILVLLVSHLLICTNGSSQENWKLFATTNSGIGSDQIEDIVIDNKGAIWVAGFTKLSRYNGLVWTVYDIPGHANDLELRLNGNLLIATTKGLYEFDTENYTLSSHLNIGIPGNHLECVAENSKEQIWVGYTVGTQKIAFYDGLNWSVEFPNTASIGTTVYSMDCFGDEMWAGLGSSLLHHNGNSWEIFDNGNSQLSGGLVAEVKCDKNGKVWIGTLRGTISQNFGRLITYDQTDWIVIDELDCNALLDGVCAIEPNDSSYWFTSYWNGFVNSNLGTYTFFDETNTIIPNDYAISIATDNSNNVFMGTTAGLVVYNSDTINIDAYKYENVFQFYPNPVRHQLFVTFSLNEAQEIGLSFYGSNGSIAKQVKYDCESGRNQIELDVSNLSRGTYLLRFAYDDISSTRKIIIM